MQQAECAIASMLEPACFSHSTTLLDGCGKKLKQEYCR